VTFKLGEFARPDQRLRCWRKQKWGSRGAAEAQLRSLLKRTFVRDVERLNVYRCPFCDGYHVGRFAPPEGRRS